MQNIHSTLVDDEEDVIQVIMEKDQLGRAWLFL